MPTGQATYTLGGHRGPSPRSSMLEGVVKLRAHPYLIAALLKSLWIACHLGAWDHYDLKKLNSGFYVEVFLLSVGKEC